MNNLVTQIVFCLGLLTPLAYLALRYNYRLALQSVFRDEDRREVLAQYRILLICLCIAVVMVLSDHWVVGLPMSVLFGYLAVRVVKSQITVVAVRRHGKPVFTGKESFFAAGLHTAFSLFILGLAIARPI